MHREHVVLRVVQATLLLPAICDERRTKRLLPREISTYFDGQLAGRTMAVWGLAFKPETDDVREAPGCMLVADLVTDGAQMRSYDPMAMLNARALLTARPLL